MNCKGCGMESRVGQFWPNDLCPKCEAANFADRQRQAAAALTGEVKFYVMRGGSGRWIAQRITGGDPDRPSKGLPMFVGHVPRKADRAGDVVRRQIERAWARGEFASLPEIDAAPRGGHSFVVTIVRAED